MTDPRMPRKDEIQEIKQELEATEPNLTDAHLDPNAPDSSTTELGISLGLTQPVYIIAMSPSEHKALTLHALMELTVEKTLKNLEEKAKGAWPEGDDDLFGYHTHLAIECMKYNAPSLAIEAWRKSIRKAVEACEAEMRKSSPAARLHKGAILHNVAACHFIAGDLDSAFQLFSAAGTEDKLLGRGDSFNVVLGNHDLTKGRMIEPIVKFGTSPADWCETYKLTLSKTFDETEAKSLLLWLAAKEQDAIQLLHALHRFVMSSENFPSVVQPHIQVRAIADIILVIESSLRRWQSTVTGQLHARMESCLPRRSVSRGSFNDANDAFTSRFPAEHPDRETEVAINWAINDCLNRFQTETSTARKAGAAAFLAVKLRNSLMHVILEEVSLYSSDTQRYQVAGMMLAVVGLSKSGQQGTIPTA